VSARWVAVVLAGVVGAFLAGVLTPGPSGVDSGDLTRACPAAAAVVDPGTARVVGCLDGPGS
jgi:hypothetical protein